MGSIIKGIIFGMAGTAFTVLGYPPSDAKAVETKDKTISRMIPFSEGGRSGR